MYRPPVTGDSSSSGNNGTVGGTNGGTNSYWPSSNNPRITPNSNESNLREIRDSLVPFRAHAAGGAAYSSTNMTSSQAISSSTFMEQSSSSSQQCWASTQQLYQMLTTPNGLSMAPGGLEASYNGGGGGIIPGQIPSKQTDLQQATKFRPAGAHHKEALIQIKQSLQPYSTASAYSTQDGSRNMDTLSSESSSGTTGSIETAVSQNGPPLHESVLLDQLVQMGFERESAWYALKLTQFRSLNLAVDVLLKINMSHVFRDQEAKTAVSRKPSFDSGENGAGVRSESPMPRIPTPQGRHYQPGPAVPCRSSAVSTSGSVYTIPTANQRTPSPMSKPTISSGSVANTYAVSAPHFGSQATAPSSTASTPIASQFGPESAGYLTSAGAGAGSKRSHISVILQSPPRNNGRGDGNGRGNGDGNGRGGAADSQLVRERVTPVILQADKRQVEKPMPQNAVSPTVIAVNNNTNLAGLVNQTRFGTGGQDQSSAASRKVLSAHFDHPHNLQTVRINVQPANDLGTTSGHYVMKYQLEANTTTGHTVSIQGRGAECANTSAEADVYSDLSSSMNQNQSIRQPPPLSVAKLSSQRILLSSPLDAAGAHSSQDPDRASKSVPQMDYSQSMAQLQKQQQMQSQQHVQNQQHLQNQQQLQNQQNMQNQQLQNQQHLQNQQNLQNYFHHIVVGGNGPGEPVPEDPAAEQQQQQQQQQMAFNQRLRMATPSFFQQKVAAQQEPARSVEPRPTSDAPPSNMAPSTIPFIALPNRFGYSKGVEYFPTVKEEVSQRSNQRGDRSSPTSSVSTEESETNAPPTTGAVAEPPPVRCESPLPESVLERCRSKEHGGAAQTSTSNSGGGGGVVKACTPQAFKFFMEQHVENVIKQHQERQTRRMQLEKEMVKANLTAQVQCQMRKLLNNKESNYLRLKRQKMNASLFEKLKAIGVGAFGEVALVRKKDTGTLFAMKTLRKSDVIQKNQAAHVKAERDILSEADNEWVVKLFYSFQDKEHLFFIMEYIPGGDMMALLIKKGIFEEDLARFYIAELVCAIQSVHKLGFIHRDIKPDNILIDRNGHIKLTDFGLCTGLRWTHQWKYYAETPRVPGHAYQDSFDKYRHDDPDANHKLLVFRQKQRQESRSLVGTPNYIAPEVLDRNGHTQLCDWWSVGVILYEMVVGHPPFLANTPEETQCKVLNWRKSLHIPPEVNLSPLTTDLILRLCCGVEERLGRESNAADIMSHPFFEDINWPTLRNSPAPYKPEILHAMDTSNFDPVEPRPDYGSSAAFGTEKMSKHDHAFYEFTFRRFFDSDGHGCPTLKSRQPYQPPRLDTVMERRPVKDRSLPRGEEHSETWMAPMNAAISNTNGADYYNRTPMRINERAMNILRISTDDDDEPPSDAVPQRYSNFAPGGMENDPTGGISGPGRPYNANSFAYYDDPNEERDSDADDDRSDLAVYV